MDIKVATQIITDEIKIPIVLAAKASRFFILNRYEAMLPAYTPVPGKGIITKRTIPKNPKRCIFLPEPFLVL